MTTTRRGFLKRLGAAAGAGALGLAPGRFRLFQRPAGSGRVLVLINLQGGYDALALVPPVAGAAAARYLLNRPRLAAASGPAAFLPLAGVAGLGLHPALGFLQARFPAGDLAIVQKTGLPAPELSHFVAQEIMSRGRAGLSHPDPRGWIGRLADLHFPNALDVVGLGVPNRVDFHANTARPLVVASLDGFQTTPFLDVSDHALRREKLQAMVSEVFGGDHRLTAAARNAAAQGHGLAELVAAAVAPVALAGNYSWSGPYHGAPGPGPWTDPLGRSLQDIARMILAPAIGTRVFYTWATDFDTHGGEETVAGASGASARPSLSDRLHVVMAALDGFVTDLVAAGRWDTTTIVLFTEFGRRNVENETTGTDHGHAFHAFVLGGAVNGGLKGNPVTAADQDPALGHPNLPVEIDYREVFRQCVEGWLQLPAPPAVFDGYAPLPGQPAFQLF